MSDDVGDPSATQGGRGIFPIFSFKFSKFSTSGMSGDLGGVSANLKGGGQNFSDVFFGQKIDFFKIIQTFRGWFLAGLDRLGGVVSPLKPFYITTRRFSEKSIFCSKKCIFTPKPVGV